MMPSILGSKGCEFNLLSSLTGSQEPQVQQLTQCSTRHMQQSVSGRQRMVQEITDFCFENRTKSVFSNERYL